MSDQQTPTQLPNELISEILTRLPAKSVTQFKCISKTWNSIISTSNFITSYISHNPQTWHILARVTEFNTESKNQPTRFLNPSKITTFTLNPHNLLSQNQVFLPNSSSLIFSSSNGLLLISILIKRDPFKNPDKYPDHFVFFTAESCLFVGNPITHEWVPLPSPNEPVTVASGLGFITRIDSYGMVENFMVVDCQTVVKYGFMLCFLSDSGKWVKKKCDNLIGMDVWECDSVFEFDNKLVWSDLSEGITIWDEDPFDSVLNYDKKALCRSVCLPSECSRPVNVFSMNETRAIYGSGGFIQYLEVFEGNDNVLRVWRLTGFGSPQEGWSLMYNVGRFDFEGRGLERAWPRVCFGHPFEVDVFFFLIGESIYSYDFRTRKVDTSFRLPRRRCFPVVLPSWPASVPKSLYAAYAKERGNEYFKDQNFDEAIKSYSKSISLSPNALAFANRAMAHIKIGSFREAEKDCTEALNLDRNYLKLYGRRALARKELGDLEGCLEDIEYALKLEPKNQEMIKQYNEIKSMLDKTSEVEDEHEGPGCCKAQCTD